MNRRQLLRVLSAAPGLLVAHGLSGSRTLGAQAATSGWTELQRRVRGRVTTAVQAEYEPARQAMLWNAIKPNRFPAAILHAASEGDVVEAVRFARRQGLKVAIRGGGHNWHNAAIRQGGIVVDLSALQAIDVDPGARRAVVQPGVRGADLIGRLAPHGLAFGVANAPQVGLSGFLLNGGLSRNSRVWGPACASVEAIDLVDARGELVRADRTRNADLFWAARGAGPGFFGVATRFVLRLHAMPRAMVRATASYAVEDADRLGAWLTDLGPMAPAAQVNCSFANGAWRLNTIAFADSEPEARTVLRPFETEPAGLKATTKSVSPPLTVEQVFGTAGESFQSGPRYLGDSMVSDASPRDLVAAAREATRAAPAGSTIAFVTLARAEGAPLPDMAFSISGTRYVHAHGLWTDAALDARNVAWVRSAVAALDPLRSGRYVGEADLALSADRPRECFSGTAWVRLSGLKRKYDPDDVFFSFPTG